MNMEMVVSVGPHVCFISVTLHGLGCNLVFTPEVFGNNSIFGVFTTESCKNTPVRSVMSVIGDLNIW
jgi:hypothetical protein